VKIKRIAIVLLLFAGMGTGLFLYATKDSFSLPVLMYHHISDQKWDEPMYVSRDEFSRQIKYLRDNKYKFMSMEEVEEYKQHKRKFPRRAVAITFDDGYEDVYRNAYPILKENGANGTVFVITSKLDEKGYLSRDQILEMQRSRVVKSESHTDNHLQLPKLNYDNQLRELTDSKDKLEKVLGTKVKYIAYPYGESNEDTQKAVRKAGYNMGFIVDSNYTRLSDDIYSLRRFWALEDFKYFTQESHVSRVSDIKIYLKKIRGYFNKQSSAIIHSS
jgi:peptidoglycan/xylan/chitin deacetylase (PgdA/CDA1 family)